MIVFFGRKQLKIVTENFHNNRKHKRGIKKKAIPSVPHRNTCIVHLQWLLLFFQLNYREASLCFLNNRGLPTTSVFTTVSMNSNKQIAVQNPLVEKVACRSCKYRNKSVLKPGLPKPGQVWYPLTLKTSKIWHMASTTHWFYTFLYLFLCVPSPKIFNNLLYLLYLSYSATSI